MPDTCFLGRNDLFQKLFRREDDDFALSEMSFVAGNNSINACDLGGFEMNGVLKIWQGAFISRLYNLPT